MLCVSLFAELLTIPMIENTIFLIYILHTKKHYSKRTHYTTYALAILLPIAQNILRSIA